MAKKEDEYGIIRFNPHKEGCGVNCLLKNNRTYNSILKEEVIDVLATNVTLSNSDLKMFISGRLNIKLDNDTAAYYKKIAMEELAIDEIGSYRIMENMFAILRDVYLGSNLTIAHDDGHFYSCFVCLEPWIELFVNNKKCVITLDGTFLNGSHGGVCLIAVFTDSNNNITPLAIAIYETESHESWTWFLIQLLQCVPELDVTINLLFRIWWNWL